MNRIRLLLVDDHVIVRRGISLLLESEPNIEIVGEVSNGRDAVKLAEELKPDIILMDLVMPEGDGLKAIVKLRRCLPEIKIIVLTTFNYKANVKAAMKAGAHGYLLKDADGLALLRAIQVVQNGGMPLHQDVTDTLVQDLSQKISQGGAESLTNREKEILRLVGKGLTNKAVAERLTISEGTVKVHVSNIFNKLGVKSRTKATLRAIDMGLIPSKQKGHYLD